MEDEHGHGGGHEVHLPDPSPWPIVAGAAALLVGSALVWWARDTGSDVAAIALGAAVTVMLLAVAGWAYEDGRMRAKAASHEEPSGGAARFTQVLTFAIAEGQLAAAREGVLAEIDSRENSLRDLAGFQDLRIVVSPAETGPAQVLVETTWSNREGLATYDETRETLLDLVGNHPEEVVPGSVQVFDMEVVRDTKDVAVRFGLGTATALIGSLIIGGFFVGAGLTLFESEGTGGEGGGGDNGNGGTPSGFSETGVIRAIDNAFPEDAVSLPPETEVTLTFANEGNTPHNFKLFQGTTAGEGPLVEGCTAGCPTSEVGTPDLVAGGEEVQFTFTTPGPGEYAFWCSLHPTEMQGVLTVAEGAPIPGEGGGSNGGGGNGGGSESDTSISAENIEFSTDQLTFAANEEVTFTFDNQDDGVPHNIEFFQGATPGEGPLWDTCTEGCDGGGSEVKTAIEPGPVEQTFTFTTPDAGTYSFWCIVHPTQMFGTITVQ